MTKDEIELHLSKASLCNPYKGLDEDDASKIAASIPTEVLSLFKALAPQRGALQAILTMYLYSIHEELKINNVKYYTPDNTDLFRRIVARRCSIAVTPEQADGSNESRRADGIRP